MRCDALGALRLNRRSYGSQSIHFIEVQFRRFLRLLRNAIDVLVIFLIFLRCDVANLCKEES